jgi:hypothetical protein
MSQRLRLLAAAAVVALAACDDAADPMAVPDRDASPVQTDSLAYTLARGPSAYRAVVTATYRNGGSAPVYFKRCMPNDPLPTVSVRRTGADSARTLFVDWAWACVGGVPTGTLAPGQSVTVRVPVGSVDQPQMQPPLRPEQLVGRLRVELDLCARFTAESDFCEPLPQPQRSSNAFLVRY